MHCCEQQGLVVCSSLSFYIFPKKKIFLTAKLVNVQSGIIILDFGNDFNHDFFDDLLEAKT